VGSFTYLGSIVDKQGGTEADVRSRIDKARTAFHQLKNVWGSTNLTLNTNNSEACFTVWSRDMEDYCYNH
jgi:hypothetical protein